MSDIDPQSAWRLLETIADSNDSFKQLLPQLRAALDSAPVAPTVLLPGGGQLGKYQIVRELASGGMGVVYEGYDPDLKRRVALKLIKGFCDEEGIARLRREAQLAASLSHPNIIQIYDVGVAEDEQSEWPPHYIAMEYISLETLQHQLPRLELSDRLRLLERVADAMGQAHAAGIVHRDLKPANILIADDGRPVVTDFGLARLEAATRMTRSGAIIGTLPYMSPEQVRGAIDEIDARTDVWALGVILYQMLSERLPFDGETEVEFIHAILQTEPPRIDRAVPADLRAICLRALEKRPAARYPDGAALAAELTRWHAGRPVAARAPSAFHRLRRWITRRPWVSLCLTLTLALIAIGGWIQLLRVEGARLREQSAQQRRQLTQARASHTRQLRRAKLREMLGPLTRQIAGARPLHYVALADVARSMATLGRKLNKLERDIDRAGLAGYPDSWQLLGEGWWLIGDLIAAERTLRQAVRLAPADRQARFWLGRLCLIRALRSKLIDWRSLHGNPPWREARALQWQAEAGEHLALAGRAAGIRRHLIQTYQAYLADNPKALQRLCALGQERYPHVLGVETFYLLDSWKRPAAEQRSLLRQALRARPHYAMAYLLRGNLARESGNLDEAIAHFGQALRINPRLSAARLFRASLYSKRGEMKRALADYDATIARRPELGIAYHNRADLYKKLKQYSAALADFSRTIALPGEATSHLHRVRADVHCKLGNHRAELTDAKQAMRLSPRDAISAYRRARVHGRCLKDPARAIRYATQAIEFDPTYFEAYVIRGGNYKKLQQLTRAQRDITQAITLRPDPARRSVLYYIRARIELDQKDWTAAREDLDRAIRINPRYASAYKHRARAWAKLGDARKSRADRRMAAKLQK